MATMARRRPVRPLRTMLGEQVSFRGVRDSLDATTGEDRLAALLQNAYPLDPEIGGGLVGRPGFEAASDAVSATDSIRHVFQFTRANGDEFTVIFAGMSVYIVTLGSGTVTDVTPVGPTISATGQIYTVFFADGMIVSDGVNKPWHWDGTTATVLTDAPVAYGQPVVYYAKLFFINAANRIEIMWSEENDATIGYDQGGFNNAWQLGITDQDPLFALYPTNEALYYFRAFSSSAIVGAVTDEFQTSGVQEGISAEVGTRSPRSIVSAGRDIWFLDADNRPQVIQSGGGLVSPPPWKDARETARTISKADQDRWRGYFWSPARLVMFAVSDGTGELDKILVFEPGARQFFAVFNGFSFAAIAEIADTDGTPAVVHGGEDSFLYKHGNPRGSLWTDRVVAGDVAIAHIVAGPAMLYDVSLDKIYTRLDLAFRVLSNLTASTVQFTTPTESVSVALEDVEGSGSLWGGFVWDEDVWGSGEGEEHLAVGFSASGRWLQARLEHAQIDEQFGLLGWQAEARILDRRPKVK